jgi:hypothetical protein
MPSGLHSSFHRIDDHALSALGYDFGGGAGRWRGLSDDRASDAYARYDGCGQFAAVLVTTLRETLLPSAGLPEADRASAAVGVASITALLSPEPAELTAIRRSVHEAVAHGHLSRLPLSAGRYRLTAAGKISAR